MSKIEVILLYFFTALFTLLAPILIALPPMFMSMFICPEQYSLATLAFGFIFRIPLFLAYLTLLPCWFSYGRENRRHQIVPLLIAGLVALPLGLLLSMALIRGVFLV